MKRPYVAPQLQVEVYELSTSIASNCGLVVHNGPATYYSDSTGNHEHYLTACSDYLDTVGGEVFASTYNVDFYDNGCCDCYTTGSGNYWTS